MCSTKECLEYLKKNSEHLALTVMSALCATPSKFDTENQYRWLKKVVIRDRILQEFPDFLPSDDNGHDFVWRDSVKMLMRTKKSVFSHEMSNGELSIPQGVSLKNRNIGDMADNSDKSFNFDVLLIIQEEPFGIGFLDVTKVLGAVYKYQHQWFGEFRASDYHFCAIYNDAITDAYKDMGDSIFDVKMLEMRKLLCDLAKSITDGMEATSCEEANPRPDVFL